MECGFEDEKTRTRYVSDETGGCDIIGHWALDIGISTFPLSSDPPARIQTIWWSSYDDLLVMRPRDCASLRLFDPLTPA